MKALRAWQVFDGTQVVSHPVVLVDEGTIVDVGVDIPDGADVLDLGEVTLLPGLVDAHQHLVFDGNGSLEEQVVGRTDDELRDRARANAERALRAGITTIRDLGDRNFVTLELRDDPELPTILAAGPPLTADGGHCWYLGGCCRDRDELIAAVHDRKARGCDVVKIMVTGGSLTPTFPMWASQFTTDDVRATVSAAHALGLPVAAHCHGVDGIGQSLDAGVDTIEHCTFYTASGSAEPDDLLVERLAASGIAVSATWGALPGFAAPPTVEANKPVIMNALAKIHALGGTVVVGTDAGISPGKPHDVLPQAARELRAMGFTPPEILATFTAKAAEVCGVGNRKGRIAPGYDADLLAVEGDPLTDPDDLTRPRFVMNRGRVLNL